MPSNEDLISALNPIAARCALDFLALHPTAVLTSGKRSVKAQADAMAADTTLDPQFVAKTYRKPLCAAAAACQAWVDAQISCPTGDVLSAAFEAILGGFSPSELELLSYHLGGNAFDVHVDNDPQKVAALSLLARARSERGGKALFLEKEAGLPRWHFQAV